MKKLSSIILALLLFGCGSSNTAQPEVEDAPTYKSETVTMYKLNDRVEGELEKILKSNEEMNYYLKLNGTEDILIETFDGSLEAIDITAQGKDVPTISLCQDALGSWLYQYHLYYPYQFEYTKNGTTRNAKMDLISFFGNGEGLWGEENKNSIYEVIHLQANGESFNIRINNGKTYNQDNEEIIFTDDLEQKILKYYQEYKEKAILYESGLVDSLTTAIETYGDKIEYQPFQLGEIIDSNVLSEKSDKIQEIKPLLYLHSENVPDYYTETGLYLFKSHYSYGILDENHKVVMPCISTKPMYVIDGDMRKELTNFSSSLNREELYELNKSGISVGGHHGFISHSYLHDGTNLYLFSTTDAGSGVIKLEKPYVLEFDSIPVTLINNVESIIVNGLTPYESYSYDIIGYSLMNSKGELLTQLKYSEINLIVNDYVPVKGEFGKWGMLDTTGKQIIPLVYNSVSYAHGKYAIVSKDFQYGVIDLDTKEMVHEFIDASNMIFWNDKSILHKDYQGNYTIISLDL